MMLYNRLRSLNSIGGRVIKTENSLKEYWDLIQYRKAGI